MQTEFYIGLAVVYLWSTTFNWLVQLGYYCFAKSRNPKAFTGQRTLLDYKTGLIGDGLIVPLVNILIYIVIYNMTYRPSILAILESFLAAAAIDFIVHYFQGRLKMTNWSMPRLYKWNFAGKWHMVSLFFQATYLILFFRLLMERGHQVMAVEPLRNSTLGVFGLMGVFGILWARDNGWV